jgi:putative ABC transport system ATP-binding protein
MTALCVHSLEVTRGQGDQAFIVGLPELTLSPGRSLAITGPSGCGKSTLVEALGLILRPSSLGQFHLLKQNITDTVKGLANPSDARLSKLRANHYGFVPQSNGLLPFLTVKQNVELQARIMRRTLKAQWLEQACKTLGLNGLLNRLPRELSIGQRQRVSFLRAIAHQPDILLADEPTAALDPIHASNLFKVMLGLAAEIGTATLVVTHEWELADSFNLERLSAVQVDERRMEFRACGT